MLARKYEARLVTGIETHSVGLPNLRVGIIYSEGFCRHWCMEGHSRFRVACMSRFNQLRDSAEFELFLQE